MKQEDEKLEDEFFGDLEIEFITPKEAQQSLTLKLKRSLSIEETKMQISKEHSLKPEPDEIKMIYKGKPLKDEQVLQDLINND